MSLSAVLICSYIAVGVVVSFVIGFSDYYKKRLSITRVISELAFLSHIAFLFWALLWPLWVAMLIWESKASEEDFAESTYEDAKQEAAPKTEKMPNQSSEPTLASGTSRAEHDPRLP